MDIRITSSNATPWSFLKTSVVYQVEEEVLSWETAPGHHFAERDGFEKFSSKLNSSSLCVEVQPRVGRLLSFAQIISTFAALRCLCCSFDTADLPRQLSPPKSF